jgi:signal transduction histidine kinase/ligand-binding sensor domain-containing protein
MLAKPIVLVALLSILAGSANALDVHKSISQLTHTSWSAKDGIPGPIRAITQSADGYLWLGTEAGLYRFDGLHFVAWKPAFGEQLPSLSVWSLCVSHDGSLWIGFGSSGISQLRDGHLKNYSPKEGVPDGGVLSIVEDASGSIWAGGQYGFSKFEGGRWRSIGAEMGYRAPGAQALLVDHRGTLWAATDGLNFRLSNHPVMRNTIVTLAPGDQTFQATGQAVGQVWMMAEAPDGEVWVADTSNDAATPMGRKGSSAVRADNSVVCLLFDNSSSLWMGLVGVGLRRTFEFGRSEAPQTKLDRFEARDGLSGGLVYSTFKDREGNIWFGTAAGVDRFRDNKVLAFSAREGLSPDQLIALASAPNAGVWVVSYTANAARLFRDGRFLESKIPPYSPQDDGRILSLHVDASGGAWVGGSFKLAKETLGRFSFMHAADIEKGANVEAITIDSTGGLWIGETGWIDEAGTESASKVLRFHDGDWTDFSKAAGLPKYRSRVMYADPAGPVWLGFEDGEVAVYAKGEFHIYSQSDGLPRGRVFAITRDRRGNVWIGGEGGLSHFDHGRFSTLSQVNGLPGTSVSAVVEDDDGLLWIASALGIFRVSQQEVEKALTSPSYQMRGLTIGASDGLRGLPRQKEPFPTATRAGDGRLWFATTGGIAVIDPRQLPTNHIAPPIVIETIKADDRVLAASSALRLPPRTRNLEFSYAALSLTDSDRVRFRYKLEGYDDDWRGPISARQVAYTNLAPRDYRFRLIACNNDGVWNEEGAVMAFTILPAFYQTNLFRLTSVLLFVGMAWAGYRLRVEQVARQLNLRLDERIGERTRIARELHDTLLQGLQGLILRFQAVYDRLPPDAPVRAAMDQALERADRVLIEGRDRVLELRGSYRIEDDLPRAIAAIADEQAPGGAVPFRITVEGAPRALHAVVDDEVRFIVREALFNIVRHAAAHHIEIEINYAANEFCLRCRDDGCGIDDQTLEAGGREGHWGITGMRERAAKMRGRLSIWSRPTAGTEIELKIPAATAYARRRPAARG